MSKNSKPPQHKTLLGLLFVCLLQLRGVQTEKDVVDRNAKRLIVKLKQPPPGVVTAQANAVVSTTLRNASLVAGSSQMSREERLSVLDLTPDADVASVQAELMGNAEVEYVEEDQVVTIDQVFGNDPLRSAQWGLRVVQTPWAWTRTRGSAAVRVCVIDTGVDATHPDIQPNIRSQGSRAGWLLGQRLDDAVDENSHGTHVAGIVAAVGNNGIGVSGISQVADIWACRFMDRFGNGYLSDATQCINWCSRNGVKVIVASWGGASNLPQTLASAIRAFGSAGGLFVNAAMNFGTDLDASPLYPPSLKLPNMLIVGAVDESNRRASYSCYGKNTVNVFAPGSNILSTVPMSSCSAAQGCYEYKSGTSMAAPLVAGQALLLMAAGVCTGITCRPIITATVDKSSGLNGLAISAGTVNIAKSLMVRTSFRITACSGTGGCLIAPATISQPCPVKAASLEQPLTLLADTQEQDNMTTSVGEPLVPTNSEQQTLQDPPISAAAEPPQPARKLLSWGRRSGSQT